mgnify:CR=1 FL=1
MNIVFAVSELEGLVKTGGLADVAKALPLALNNLEQDARVALPYYQQVAELLPPAQAERTFTFSIIANQEFRVKVHQFEFATIPVYCFDIEGMFDRDGIYGESYHPFDDNGQRFTLFSIAILNFFQHFAGQLQFEPQAIHCNDWHTAVLPALMKNDKYWQTRQCTTLLSIHNGAYQGIFEKHTISALLSKLGQDHPDYEKDVVNFLKFGITFADKVVAVSPNYASELLTELGSHHLFDIFDIHRRKVSGILNGCDYKDWSPHTDQYINQQYSVDNIADKAKNKLALQNSVGLTADTSIPLISMVCRLTDQKGLNFLLPAIKELVKHKVQICIAGTGDPIYVDQLEYFTQKYADNFHFVNTYSEHIAHSYIAGADFFMMPSLFEPCGLTQMYSLAYGTLPIVRQVGGLKDTVTDLSCHNATGVVFKEPTASSLLAAVRKGLLFYHEYPDKFVATQERAMQTKFLWQDSAKLYLELYEQPKEAAN